MPKAFPQLFGQVWGEGRHHDHQRFDLSGAHRAAAGTHRVEIFHHRRNGRVVTKFGYLLGGLFDGFVQLAFHVGVEVCTGLRCVNRIPQSIEKSVGTLDAFVAVVAAFFQGDSGYCQP